jgi:hypothetical protein
MLDRVKNCVMINMRRPLPDSVPLANRIMHLEGGMFERAISGIAAAKSKLAEVFYA